MKVDLALEGLTAAVGPTLPVAATHLTLQGQVPFTPSGPLALQLAGYSDLANLKTILDRVVQPGQYSLLADLHADGSARFSLDLGGTLPETTLDGTLTLQGGRAVVHGYPLSVENLDFTAQFKGRDIIIPRDAPLRGTLAQGALTAWGQMTWRLGGVEAYDLHASLEDFQLRDLPDGFDLQGSVDASLKGSDQDGGLLSGSIWAKRTLYRTEINLTDLILANALGGSARLSTPDPSDPLARIELDLELHLAEPWELDTNLLKLQGRPRGPFFIGGTLVQPGLKGRMELLPGGRLTNLFPAGDIVLERGTVDFADPTFFNPNFDIQGQIDIPPYLVSLNFTGTLDALQARPFSTPSLRQDEIFAILIDPAAVTLVGGAPGSSTQSAVNTGLAGTSTGLLTSLALANFQEQLRKALSLDRVSVALRAGIGTPETSITLGKSVNLFGYRTPLVFTHNKAGEVTTISGQVEWRFGNLVFRLGASQSTADSLAPSGEVRHTWSPR
jgi:autotransporter translocation and assembly factor TamB